MAAGEEITSWQDRATYDRYFAVVDHIQAGDAAAALAQVSHLVADAVQTSPGVNIEAVTQEVQQFLAREVLDMLEQHARGEPLPPSPSSMWGWGVEEISELMRASADN